MTDMKTKAWLAILALAAVCGPARALAAAPAPDLSGTWSGPLVTNDNQSDAVKLILTKKGSSYRGTVSDELGIIGPNTELVEVVQKGDKLGFAFSIVEGGASLKILVSLELAAGKLKGRWEDQQNGSGGAVELTRTK
jgi:hypothetical protein